ncbi:MAG TPA: BatD family protein [Candidatus Polarisedimenticolia bacterium]|nr:BatD family protein [Candidatus Polarisedimenticolia bacterium]
MRRWVRLAILLLLFAPATTAFSQEVEVTATAEPNRVEEGQEVELKIQINGTDHQPDQPPSLQQIPGFVSVSGPSVSSYFQWVNGRSSSSRSYTWILVPQGKGVHSIPPIPVTLDGTTYRTPMLRVDVVERGAGGGSQGGGGGQPNSPFADPWTRRRLATPPRGSTPASLFVEAVVDKTDVYPGEQVSLMYKVYTQYELSNMALQDQPSYEGFWVEDIKPDDKYDARTIQRKEGTFMEYTVLKKALFPNSSGNLTIPALTFHFAARRRSNDPFDSFLFQPTESLFRSSQEIRIHVKDLPVEGRPPEFDGAVGRYTLSVKADRNDTKVNDAVGLKVEVEGQGNISTLSGPRIPALPDFKQYDPKVQETPHAKAGTMVGKKTWEYVLIPLAAGAQEIPPVRFAYFDPKTASYQVLQSEPIHLKVARGEAGDLPGQPFPARADIAVLGTDIRYIKMDPQPLRDQARTLAGSPLFLAALAGPLALNTGLLLMARRRSRLAGSEGLVRRRKARRLARRKLARARSRLSRSQPRDFYQEVASALTGYLADKATLPASGLTYDRIEEILDQRGVEPALRDRFRRCLETCDFARFAPSASEPGEMAKALGEAEWVVEAMEGSVKSA